MSAFVNKCPRCRTKVKIHSRSLDGRKARCPRCSAAFRIKAPPERGGESAHKPPSFEFSVLGRLTEDDLADYGPVDDEFDESEEKAEGNTVADIRPRHRDADISRRKPRRRRESSARGDLLIGGIVIGFGLLLLVTAGFWAARYLPNLRGGGAASRLAWMPDDIEGFLEIDPEELWQARALRPVREAKTGVKLREHLDKLLSPLVFSEIERVAIGFPPPGGPHPEPVFVLYAKSAFDVPKLTSQEVGFREASHAGETYLVGRQPPRAAYFARSDVLIYGTEEQIKSAIDRGGVCAAADDFDIPRRGTIVFAARHPRRFGTPSLLPIAGHDAGLAAAPAGLSRFAFAVNVAYDFAVSGTLSYESTESAEALVASTREQVEKQTAELEKERNEKLNTDPSFKLNLYGVKQLLTAQQELLRSVDIRRSGSRVDVELTVPSFLFEFSFAFFESLAADLLPGAELMDEEPEVVNMPDDVDEPEE